MFLRDDYLLVILFASDVIVRGHGRGWVFQIRMIKIPLQDAFDNLKIIISDFVCPAAGAD